jgi:hypothetical protein
MQVHSRDDRESMSLLFCLGIVKPLSLRSGLDICSFPFKHVFVVFVFYFSKKKKLGDKMQNFIFFLLKGFQILYMFFA